ncbi:DNA-binding MarR family transcriptional regulator [Bacillus ectoiniformans]|uniref:MarR family winged helix-turn-helix transcriptional regulator n=1 Tax=Bacillus ectoiniformans TaxID=1494429 RepID=UPI0019565423|nr:MarR family transcriptional regulator [Bacillus ectoiniformans]MBM7649473.1 DNA-binding MarR family transcriptional regulator [Bacillus ectoiniformans]
MKEVKEIDCSKQGEIINQLNEIYKWMSPKFERCTGISQTRLELLHFLYEVDEISQTELQKKMKIDGAAVTRHLKQLEEKEMVARRKNPDDQRFTFVRLTKQGRDRLNAFRLEKEQFIQKVFNGFSDHELIQFSEQLRRVQKNVKSIQE